MDRSSQAQSAPAAGLRVAVAAGGTAGHVVPALAVADELRDRGVSVSFIGAEGRIETELVPQAGYPLDLLKVSGLDRRNPLKAARSAIDAAVAVRQARSIRSRRRADVVMGGGGFVVGPVGLAARSRRLPLVLTEADRHLGLANRLLAKRATKVCLAYPDDDRQAPLYEVTGRAIPKAILNADRDRARERFGIGPVEHCLLVMGGSQGARSINLAAVDAFSEDTDRSFHVLHLAGRRDYADLRDRLAMVDAQKYTLIEYEPDLGDCLAACDLVVARSGGSIFEILAWARPAILVPYPFATADHQTANARWAVDAGAADLLADAELTADTLAARVEAMLAHQLRMIEMSVAARDLARPDAAERIAQVVLEAAGLPPITASVDGPPQLPPGRGGES